MKALEAKGGEDENEKSEDENEKSECKDGEVPKVPPSNPGKRKAQKSEWKYNETKTTFIASLKKDGLKYSEAVAEWDQSLEKKQLLGSISLPELKKRRFVDRSCKSNPWA